jgi:hypothetical protein
MSGIVLSASVRQNLLSLQSTADLLATTQNRLATGKKVNTALDNPTNYFTAASLDNRASDINNLLDGIGNGVQVLQAANTGITSLQKLVDSAKSVANQALQSIVGYSQKSTVASAAIPGANVYDLRGTTTYTNAQRTGTAVNNNLAGPVAITAATKLVTAAASDSLAATPTGVLTVNGKTITFSAAQTTSTTDASGNVTLGTGAGSTLAVSDLLTAIDSITGATGASASTISATGQLQISTGTASDLVISGTGTSLTAFGLTAGTTARTGTIPLDGLTLTIGATGNGHATSITLRDGTGGTVKSLMISTRSGAQQPAGHRRFHGRDFDHDHETPPRRRSARSAVAPQAPACRSPVLAAPAPVLDPGRNRFAPTSCRNTTISWIDHSRPPRTLPSTASTCSTATSSS